MRNFISKNVEREETRKYIEHQLETTGAKHPIFTSEAIDAIYGHTRGIPREITFSFGFSHFMERCSITTASFNLFFSFQTCMTDIS
jgi:hypothetical protein